MRSTLVVALFVVGCTDAAKVSSAPAPAVPQRGAATVLEAGQPQAPVPVEVQHVGPLTLFDDYQRNELAADSRYLDKRVRMVGLVAAIRKDAFGAPLVEMAARTPFSLHLRFDSGAVQRLSELSRGQLVGVECTGRGLVLNTPQLSDCSLGWVEPSVVEPLAAQASASYQLCVIERYEQSYAVALDAGHRADGGVLPSKGQVAEVMRFAAKVRTAAETDLNRLKMERLACNHVLVEVMRPCDDEGAASVPHCKAKIVRAMTKHLHR